MALPAAAVSLDEANAAIELWEFYKGRTLDAGQRLDVSIMLATRDDGLWAASVTGHEKPRQSGKGDAIEVVELWGLTQRAERILHTIHDAVLLATETHSRMLSLIEGHADLRRLKARDWKGTGQQMIEMRNGGIVWYRTRTGSGGRGVDEVDRLIVDEAQHAEQQHLASVTPTQAVAANPQLNALGTGGLPDKSAWWWSLRIQAKTGSAGSLAWAGWSAQPWSVDVDGGVELGEVDPHDRALWWATIPGLVAGRTTIEFLERELSVLGPAGFAQEYLCEWAPPPDNASSSGPISPETWQAAADEASQIESHRQWAVACSSDLKWSSIGVAGRTSEGKYHVEWMEHRSSTGWLVERIVEGWKAKKIPIRVHSGGAEKFLIQKLRERGVEVVEVSTSDAAAATGDFIAATNEGQLVHLDQPSLNKALRGAVLKVTESGSSMWSEKSSAVEITPLKAVTVALGGVPEVEEPAARVAMVLGG